MVIAKLKAENTVSLNSGKRPGVWRARDGRSIIMRMNPRAVSLEE
jgi:hypothetical protein